ncbi:hypothetical protein JVU11DRAFT_9211 [Chiua virens]|nr:hypothetical protein JVU11DRAFT_9211 [Chiua virens]
MQRDVQCCLIAVITRAAPPGIVLAIHSLLDFSYLGQAPELSDEDCSKLHLSLHTFHKNKEHVTKAGGHKGKKGVITNWYIPKLELLQNVIPSIQNSGALSQWTADITEHAHILMIKNLAQRSNQDDIDPQICWYLDHLEKCSRFELAISLQEQGAQGHTDGVSDGGSGEADGDLDGDIEEDTCLFQSVAKLGQPKCSPTNYFSKACDLSESMSLPASAQTPFPP